MSPGSGYNNFLEILSVFYAIIRVRSNRCVPGSIVVQRDVTGWRCLWMWVWGWYGAIDLLADHRRRSLLGGLLLVDALNFQAAGFAAVRASGAGAAIEHLSKAEHDLIKEVHPKVDDIHHDVGEVVAAVKHNRS